MKQEMIEKLHDFYSVKIDWDESAGYGQHVSAQIDGEIVNLGECHNVHVAQMRVRSYLADESKLIYPGEGFRPYDKKTGTMF